MCKSGITLTQLTAEIRGLTNLQAMLFVASLIVASYNLEGTTTGS